jgi:hypothetical protein
MKAKTDIILIPLILLLFSYTCGQMKQYNFKRDLKGITDEWHTIVLPDSFFGRVTSDLSDIRIFGITADHDTLEAPYILKLTTEKILHKEVNFNLINQSKNEQGYYFTFELTVENPINQINLDFKQRNFDWRLKLAGSQNQLEWFTIIDNYRILSIQNEHTNYQFTSINFPDSKYRYFRLLINSKEKPELQNAKMATNEVSAGIVRNYRIKAIKIYEEKSYKQTVIDLDLESPVPVSFLKIDIKDKFDFYRPMYVDFSTDSFETQQGWKYNYSSLVSGILNSIENNEFKFNSTILQKIKIKIYNYDNEPLAIEKITVGGYVHQLLVRFSEPATYFLVYGCNKANKPYYDLDRFADKIPGTLTVLKLGEEQLIEKEKPPQIEPIFKNKFWLWAIIILIILLIGRFTVIMIQKK